MTVKINTHRKVFKQNPARKNFIPPIVILGSLFFVFGFITWINSVLIPYLQIACELSNVQAYFVTFSFYIAYFVMALPSGWLLKRTGFKKGMATGLVIMSSGALLFIPAALSRNYDLFLAGLFVQGTGLALLQTASNPYVTIIGPLESAAKRISIMGICNKVAGAIAPIILGAIALKDIDDIKAKIYNLNFTQREQKLDLLASRVIIPYIVIVAVLLVLALVIYFSKLPEINTDNTTNEQKSGNEKKFIFHFPHLLLGVFALFFYVGVEVIAGDTIINYGAWQGIRFSVAKFFTTATLVSMIIGYLIGITCIPKYLSQQKALQYCAVLGLVFSVGVICTNGVTSVLFVALLGLANSLMWPAIWPLALSGLGKFTRTGSALLIMSIAGGAILPLLYGKLADLYDAKQAYIILLPSYVFILFYAVTGHKVGKVYQPVKTAPS